MTPSKTHPAVIRSVCSLIASGDWSALEALARDLKNEARLERVARIARERRQ